MRHYQRRKKPKQFKHFERLKLFIDGDLLIKGCWRFEKSYQRLDGAFLHQQWASGKGEVVRHLCGDNRCVNPLHLVRGNEVDNAKDELAIRNFSVEVLQNLIGEVYNDKYPNELSILILMPRVRVICSDRFKTMRNVSQYAREKYRRQFESGFARSCDIEKLDNIRQKFISLASRNDIIIERT